MEYSEAVKEYLKFLKKQKFFWLDKQEEEMKYIEHNSDRFESALIKVEYYIQTLELPLSDLQMLDIGTSPLTFILRHKYPDIRLTSIDLTIRFEKACRDLDIQFKKMDLNSNLDLGCESYDIVLFLEVIEHLQGNHRNVLISIVNSLKWGGMCILQTPNRNSLKNWLVSLVPLSVLNKFSENPSVTEEFDHYKEYTKSEIIDIVNGLDNVKIISAKNMMYFDTYKASMAYRRRSFISKASSIFLYLLSFVLVPFRRGMQIVFVKI